MSIRFPVNFVTKFSAYPIISRVRYSSFQYSIINKYQIQNIFFSPKVSSTGIRFFSKNDKDYQTESKKTFSGFVEKKTSPHSSINNSTIKSSENPMTLEELQNQLRELNCDEQVVSEITEKAWQKAKQPFLVDMLFEYILSIDQINAIDSSILDRIDSRGNNLLHLAAALGNQEKFNSVFELYKKKPERFAKNLNGLNSLHIASASGHSHIIKTLLYHGFKHDEKDNYGLAPIHWAIHESHPKAVDALIKHGASLATTWTTTEGVQYSPLAMTIAAGNPAVLKILLENNQFYYFNLTQSIPYIGTVLHVAIQNNQPSMLAYLLSEHTNEMKTLFYHQDPQGRSPLQLAAYLGDLSAIRLFHRYGIVLDYGEGEKEEQQYTMQQMVNNLMLSVY
jgi:ankyrin repeat protein